VLFAVAAIAVAVGSRHVETKRRLAIVSLALPAIVAVPTLIWVVLTVVLLAD
jgi:hypothetical protein